MYIANINYKVFDILLNAYLNLSSSVIYEQRKKWLERSGEMMFQLIRTSRKVHCSEQSLLIEG